MPNAPSSIIDNRGENTLLSGLQQMSSGGREIWIATAFFSLEALALLAGTLSETRDRRAGRSAVGAVMPKSLA